MLRVAVRTLVTLSALATVFVSVPTVGTAAYADASSATVTGLAPDHGPAGTIVDVTGTGLTGAQDVAFVGPQGGQVHAAFTPDSANPDTHLQVTVPAGARTGPVVVRASDGSTVTGPPFTVRLPAKATLTLAPTRAVAGSPTRVTASVTTAGEPVSGAVARLIERLPGTTSWRHALGLKTSNAQGTVVWSARVRSTRAYRVVFHQTRASSRAVTPVAHLTAVPLVTLSAPGTVPTRTPVDVRGRVAPHERGDHVVLQQRAGGHWRRAGDVTTDKDGRFSVGIVLPEVGRYAYRAHVSNTAQHAGGTSHVARVMAVARTLRQGMQGADVRALQQRLARMHYDVGAVNGSFGFDTVHAVTAFQKVQGLSRDGVVGSAVWARLAHPRIPHLHYPQDAGTAGIEVNLAHQVVFYAEGGRIVRILDSSTGGGYTYTGSDGTPQKAVTPRGHFQVEYKRDGWVTSKLGSLYRPAYFNYDGYAIHGETEVPNYPASHGCVRITVPAMDRLNAKLYVGLSVWIY